MVSFLIYTVGFMTVAILGFWLLSVRSKHSLRNIEQKPALPKPDSADRIGEEVKLELLDVRVRPEHPQIEFVVLKIGITEMRIWLQFHNDSQEPITIENVTWTFWFGKMIKSGKFSQGLEIKPNSGAVDYAVQEVMSEVELKEIVQLKSDQHPNFYMEGEVFCRAKNKLFQKKFTGFNLRYQLVGYSEATKSADFNAQTHLDSLTGFLQRRFLDEHLQTMIDSTVYRSPISFIMVDVDDFKHVNDNYGHLMGDDVIKAVCSQIKEVLGDRGLAIRYGGDEFGIVLESFDSEQASHIAEKIRDAVDRYKFVVPDKPDAKLKITLSIGVGTLTRQEDYKVLIEKADKMLYQSKKKGKNQVSVDFA